jgi:hypothetical protein
MQTSRHFSHLNLQQAVAQRIEAIAAELAELRQAGQLQIDISPSDLFYIEALGYTIDFSTGQLMQIEPPGPACTAAVEPAAQA